MPRKRSLVSPEHWIVRNWRFTAAVVSGLLLGMSFPGMNQGWIAWIALVPLVWVVLSPGSRSFSAGYVSGLVFFLSTLYWLCHVSVLGYLALSVFLALVLAAWAWALNKFSLLITFPSMSSEPASMGQSSRFSAWNWIHPSSPRNLSAAVFGGALWVALELLRTHLFTGFPWNLLGVSQYRNTAIIQISSLTGVYGVSAAVCMVNILIAAFLLRLLNEKNWGKTLQLEITAITLVFAVLIYWGLQSLRPTYFDSTRLKVGLVQGNIPQSLKWEEEHAEEILNRYAELTLSLQDAQPDLIIWPETATPKPLRWDKSTYSTVTGLASNLNSYLLVGTMDYTDNGQLAFNSCSLISRSGKLLMPYHKIHLVPFGEFLPEGPLLSWMKVFTPIQWGWDRGTQYAVMTLLNPEVRFSTLICFEDVFPAFVRNFVQPGNHGPGFSDDPAHREGAQFLVNITNDGWFGRTGEPVQHAAASVFRAVENGVPLIRAANTGLTCIIDRHGRILDFLGKGQKHHFIHGTLTGTLDVITDSSRPLTFYTRYGDVFAWGCTGLAFLMILAAVLVRRLGIARNCSEI